MNPSKNVHSAPQPTKKLMIDIARPPVQPTAGTADSVFKPDIVNNIPVRAQAMPVGKADGHGDNDLDKIMADVNRDLKNLPKRQHRAGLFSRHRNKSQSDINFSAQPRPAPQAPAAQLPPLPANLPARPAGRITPRAAMPPRKSRQNAAPVVAIAAALVVTGGLVAAAYFAYK